MENIPLDYSHLMLVCIYWKNKQYHSDDDFLGYLVLFSGFLHSDARAQYLSLLTL